VDQGRIEEIRPDQDSMLIDKKKRFHRASYSYFLKARQPIDLGKIKAPLSKEFYQASCGIEGFLGSKGGQVLSDFRKFWQRELRLLGKRRRPCRGNYALAKGEKDD